MEQLKRLLPPDTLRVVYIDPLLPTDRIAVTHAVEHSLAYDKVFGTGDGRASSKMIREITTGHFSGIYRSVLAVASPRAALEKSSRLWPRYYDQGETQLEFIGESMAIKRLLGCPDLPRHHDRLSTPYYEALLRYVGAKDVLVKRTQCVALGANHCET